LTFDQRRLIQPLTSWVWGLRCWWNPLVRFRAAGLGSGEDIRGRRSATAARVPSDRTRVGRARRPLRQFAVAAAASGLMWANVLRPFQLGKARTSHNGPWSWTRESRMASAQDSCPACHFTNASASAVM
jgi:hypothetical protein